jgi:hypothetical protein
MWYVRRDERIINVNPEKSEAQQAGSVVMGKNTKCVEPTTGGARLGMDNHPTTSIYNGKNMQIAR